MPALSDNTISKVGLKKPPTSTKNLRNGTNS